MDKITQLIACYDGRSPPEQCPSAGELKELQLLEDPRLETAFGFNVDALRNVGHFNSHYTDPSIASAIREGVCRILGRKPKSVLDPGCGSGNFYEPGVGYVGVDVCAVAAAVARRRCADGKVYHADFLDWSYPVPFEAVWGNVPFTDGVQRKRLGLHAHFIEKAVSHLALGGVLALMTSTNTLDSRGTAATAFRKEVDRQCEFLGAMRLPPGSHAGKTQVTSDVIVLRKRETPYRGTPGTWVNTGLWRVEDDNDIHCNLWWMSGGADFMFGRPVVDDLRGASGGRCYRMALRPDSECVPSRIRAAMDAMGDRSTLGRIVNLLMPTQTMRMPVSRIPDSAFTKRSGLAPLIRIHDSGCEVHFHPETTPHRAIKDALVDRGFTQANSSLFYKKKGNYKSDGEYLLKWLASSGASRYDGEAETVRRTRRRESSPSNEIPAIAAAVVTEVRQLLTEELTARADVERLESTNVELEQSLRERQQEVECLREELGAARADVERLENANAELEQSLPEEPEDDVPPLPPLPEPEDEDDLPPPPPPEDAPSPGGGDVSDILDGLPPK